MSDHCIECGKTVDTAECSVSWDDGEPIYTCDECCCLTIVEALLDYCHYQALLDDPRRDRWAEEEKAERSLLPDLTKEGSEHARP